MKTLILLLALTIAATAGPRKIRFSWDPNPEPIVDFYRMERRLVNADGTLGEWQVVGDDIPHVVEERDGKPVVQVILEDQPLGEFQVRLYALDSSAIAEAGKEIPSLNISYPSNIVTMPGTRINPPQGIETIHITIETSSNLTDWEPIARMETRVEHAAGFYRAKIEPNKP